MKKLADLVTRHTLWVILTWAVVIVALVTATKPGGLVDRADVMETDQTAFLPDRYESARAAELDAMGFPAPDGASATIVLKRTDGRPLTRADLVRSETLTQRVATVDGVRAATTGASGLSPNRRVLLGTVLFDRGEFDPLIGDDIERLREQTDDALADSGLTAGYAGKTPTLVDSLEREALTGTLTVFVILALLVALFRSVLAPIVAVGLISAVGAAATGAIVIGAKLIGFTIDTTVTGLLPIVVLGVGTDYVVFLLYRYRERLRAGDAPQAAMHHAITRIGPAIAFSALTVVVSLSALLLSDLASLRALGPALGFGVLATLVAALTLVPAVAVRLKGRLLWPSRMRLHEPAAPGRTARLVAGKPVGAVLASALVLAALAVPALGFKADYDVEADVPGSPSAKAADALESGFPEGALEPTKVLVRRDDGGRLTAEAVAPIAAALRDSAGVDSVRPVALSDDGRIARIDALLDHPPYAQAALDAMNDHIRPTVARATPGGMTAEVGGATSGFADIRSAIEGDQNVIFPIAALMVGLILVVLLRSVAVPLFVMAGVAIGFAATLGASVLAFQGVAGEPGLTFTLPLIVYLFVASMVSDYAILVLSRLREELAAGRTPREAASTALQTAGPSVIAAGLVLAGSFGVLILSPSQAQVGFAVAIGILLSAVVTARVLVPALTVLAGRRGWWPSRVANVPSAPAEAVEPQPAEPAREAIAA